MSLLPCCCSRFLSLCFACFLFSFLFSFLFLSFSFYFIVVVLNYFSFPAGSEVQDDICSACFRRDERDQVRAVAEEVVKAQASLTQAKKVCEIRANAAQVKLALALQVQTFHRDLQETLLAEEEANSQLQSMRLALTGGTRLALTYSSGSGVGGADAMEGVVVTATPSSKGGKGKKEKKKKEKK